MYCLDSCLADVAIQQLLNIYDIYNVFKLTVIANVFNIIITYMHALLPVACD